MNRVLKNLTFQFVLTTVLRELVSTLLKTWQISLKRAGINTVEELTNRTPEDMMKVRNLGRKSLDEVLKKLEELGLSLSPSDD